jgi:hypothetical protein
MDRVVEAYDGGQETGITLKYVGMHMPEKRRHGRWYILTASP